MPTISVSVADLLRGLDTGTLVAAEEVTVEDTPCGPVTTREAVWLRVSRPPGVRFGGVFLDGRPGRPGGRAPG